MAVGTLPQLFGGAGVFFYIGYHCLMKLRVCLLLLLAGVVTGSRVHAAADNPYGTITQRNVFALVPIPTNAPDPGPPPEPPPKITPNGIMNVFGKVQAMFKAPLPSKPGQPATDKAYVLCAGEREDDIEVVKIDEQNSVITFNNHGQTQELPLVAGNASAGSAPPPVAIPGMPVPPPAGVPAANPAGGNPSQLIGFGGRFGRNRPNPSASPRGSPGGGLGGGNSGGMNPSSEVNDKGIYQPSTADDGISPEARILMMEANRARLLDAGSPVASLIPPTPITKQVTGEEPAAPPVP
jgi:hypothetical protein